MFRPASGGVPSSPHAPPPDVASFALPDLSFHVVARSPLTVIEDEEVSAASHQAEAPDTGGRGAVRGVRSNRSTSCIDLPSARRLPSSLNCVMSSLHSLSAGAAGSA